MLGDDNELLGWEGSDLVLKECAWLSLDSTRTASGWADSC